MNRTLLLLLVALIPALIAGAGGYAAGRLTPQEVVTPTATPVLGTIVGRTIEMQLNGADSWQTIEPRASETVTALDIEQAITTAQSVGTNFYVNARYRITVRDVDTSAPYDVLVRSACFDAVTVGAPWPNSADVCR